MGDIVLVDSKVTNIEEKSDLEERLFFSIQEKVFNINQDLFQKSSFSIESKFGSYSVEVCEDIAAVDVIKTIPTKDILFIVDTEISRLYPDLHSYISKFPFYSIKAYEEEKTIETSINLTSFFRKHHVSKSTTLIVIGGGITQDISAFACLMYKRGIPWIFFPTTLLAQTDSCIGGKTGLNYKKIKNMHALFSVPSKVIICTDFLKTLPKNQLFSGVGEMIKLFITGGNRSFSLLEEHIDQFKNLNLKTLGEGILHSLMVKRIIIEHDELEQDIRRSLNYGHSMGHAIESLSAYKIPHGIAVLIGILVENKLAVLLGKLDASIERKIFNLAKHFVDPISIKELKNLSSSFFLDVLKGDKKTEGEVLITPLIRKIGEMYFEKFLLRDETNMKIKESIKELLKELND